MSKNIYILVAIIIVTTLIISSINNDNPKPMETTIELKSKETKIVDDLTLTHISGGHKILVSEDGSGGGDMSIANITFQTPRADPVEKRFYNENEKETFEFDNYKITLVDMTTDGAIVTLKVTKNNNESSSNNSQQKSYLKLYIGVRYFGGNEGVGLFDMEVKIDDKIVANDNFPTAKQTRSPDNISIELSRGTHTLSVKSNKADPQEFTTTFEMGDKEQYSQINYDYYPKDHVNYEKRGFNFEIQSDDFGWR